MAEPQKSLEITKERYRGVFLFFAFFLFFVFLPFPGLLLRHMEVPRLGV